MGLRFAVIGRVEPSARIPRGERLQDALDRLPGRRAADQALLAHTLLDLEGRAVLAAVDVHGHGTRFFYPGTSAGAFPALRGRLTPRTGHGEATPSLDHETSDDTLTERLGNAARRHRPPTPGIRAEPPELHSDRDTSTTRNENPLVPVLPEPVAEQTQHAEEDSPPLVRARYARREQAKEDAHDLRGRSSSGNRVAVDRAPRTLRHRPRGAARGPRAAVPHRVGRRPLDGVHPGSGGAARRASARGTAP